MEENPPFEDQGIDLEEAEGKEEVSESLDDKETRNGKIRIPMDGAGMVEHTGKTRLHNNPPREDGL